MIIVLRWNIPTVIYELLRSIWEVSNYNGLTIQYFWTKSSRRRYSNILERIWSSVLFIVVITIKYTCNS